MRGVPTLLLQCNNKRPADYAVYSYIIIDKLLVGIHIFLLPPSRRSISHKHPCYVEDMLASYLLPPSSNFARSVSTAAYPCHTCRCNQCFW